MAETTDGTKEARPTEAATHLALLRGINVGGTIRPPIAKLVPRIVPVGEGTSAVTKGTVMA